MVKMSNLESNTRQYMVRLDGELAQKVEDYRVKNHITASSQAIRSLVAKGLEAESKELEAPK